MKRKLSQRRRANDVAIWTRKKGGSEGGGACAFKALLIILVLVQAENLRKAMRTKIVDY